MQPPHIEHPLGLVFRELRPSDTQTVFEIHSDPDTRFFTRLLRQQTPEDIRSWLEYYPHYRRHGFGLWAIERAGTGTMTGICGLRVRKDLGGRIDLSYRIHPDWRRKGIATAAVISCMQFGFEHLILNEILAQVHTDNEWSRHLLVKLGFQESASDGEWIDFTAGHRSCVRSTLPGLLLSAR